MSQTYEKNCERCGTDFTARKATARYCSENCRKRACEDRCRAVCETCGGLLGPGTSNHHDRANKMCRPCFDAETERKREAILDGYRAGLSPAEIAEANGIPYNTVRQEAARMRRNGVDIPVSPYAAARGRGVAA